MTFRPPLITRPEPVQRAPELQQSNLLETTLRSKDALPFRQMDWPVPRGPEFSVFLRTWTDSYKQQLIGKDKFPTRQSDWPNPRGAEFSVALRTWTDSYKLELIGKDALPTRQRDWANPNAPAVSQKDNQQGVNLALTGVVKAPFGVTEWPNPRSAGFPVIPQHDVNLALTQVVAPPFSLAAWPNPGSQTGWMQWDGVQNSLPLTSITPTPTPAPEPTITPGGGTSRKGRRLPQYYSRQFFGEQVQLPQDPDSNEIAQDILSQTAGVLEDLREGAEFDALLQTVDQLARVASMHIESRQIYNVIEQTRARVLVKKDAEIKAYITAAIEEEDDVKEIMEFL